MIFAGMEGGLPCFVGKYVNFSGTSGRKNYISFGGQSASCALQQYEVIASFENSSFTQYFDGSGVAEANYINLLTGNDQALLTPKYFTVGGDNSFIEFDSYLDKFTCAINYPGSGYGTIEFYNNIFGAYIVNGTSHGGCKLNPSEGSFYGYVTNNGTSFASIDGSYGRLAAGVSTGYSGFYGSSSGASYAQMGQLNTGYIGFLVQSTYNQLEWSVHPNVDYTQFYVANNNQNCRVGMSVSSREASIWAYNASAGTQFGWDISGSGTLNLFDDNNSLQFYPNQGSFWGYNGQSQNQIKFDTRVGFFGLWNSSQRYIFLDTYYLEQGMTAQFHYVISGYDINGNAIYAKDASGRNIKVLSTAPIVLSNLQKSNLCAITYGT
jgi:hypothetical protein